MPKHSRLLRLPGCETHPVEARRMNERNAAAMATDAMAALPFDTLCDVIEAHLEARPDADWRRQQALARALDRKAWAGMPAEGGA